MTDRPITIRELADDAVGRWDAFVETCAQATFFHRAGWKTVIEQAFGHRCPYLYAECDGRIVGVLPLAHVHSRLFANALISTPFCVYGGAVADEPRIADTLARAACDKARALGVSYLEMRRREPIDDGWPTKSDRYCTFRRAIEADDERNLASIPRKQRAVIRKSLKNNLDVAVDTDTQRFYDLYAQSLRDLGTPVFSRRYVELLHATFGDACEVMTITHEGEPVSSVLSFYFRDEVLPYYAGAGARARELKANDFMYWQLMCHASRRGARLFDFGRSKRDTGAFEFKRHWGFEPEQLNYAYYLVNARQVPDLSPANPRYQRFIRAWQRMPVPLTRLVGPMLARSLG